MSFADRFVNIAKKILPSPFTIAILLTLATFVLALLTTQSDVNFKTGVHNIASYWEKGFWELLSFTMQMMLILVLGHILALSKPIERIINSILSLVKDNASAAALVTLFTLVFAFINWGLGLVFGALLARKVGEYALQKNIPLNYPLIGAAGYVGLMVWHGGLSGSAPITINTPGHSLVGDMGLIPLSQTVFSNMNLVVSASLLIALPLLMYWLGKRGRTATYQLSMTETEINIEEESAEGAERLDHSRLFALIIGFLFIAAVIHYSFQDSFKVGLNFINFILFGTGIILHGSLHNFSNAAKKAIGGSTGIMIQFPLYAGIMGIMKYSGLVGVFSDFFVGISNSFTFPIFTFISAGIVNVFVPSGGGQWAVQGPIIIQAAETLGVSLPKSIMALAYGDQITNMLQPFWALPLLGITGLKAKEILPYTIILMLAGILIFVGALMIF